VTTLNVAALAAIASAPPPPEATVEGAVSTDTLVKISAPAGFAVRVHCRRTDASQWEACPFRSKLGPLAVAPVGSPSHLNLILERARVDDWIFGASLVSKDGYESPVASAVPGGAFKPWVKPVDNPPR